MLSHTYRPSAIQLEFVQSILQVCDVGEFWKNKVDVGLLYAYIAVCVMPFDQMHCF
jgi:hypothetical protein